MIEKSEIQIIIKGAIKMAQQDHKVVESESDFLEKIMAASGMEDFEVTDFTTPVNEDIDSLIEELSSKQAKQAFLLTIAAMAMVDGELDQEEKTWFMDLSKKINVGMINLDNLSQESAQQMVYKVLKAVKPVKTSGKQLMDIDLM